MICQYCNNQYSKIMKNKKFAECNKCNYYFFFIGYDKYYSWQNKDYTDKNFQKIMSMRAFF